jgi:hypothetical protein
MDFAKLVQLLRPFWVAALAAALLTLQQYAADGSLTSAEALRGALAGAGVAGLSTALRLAAERWPALASVEAVLMARLEGKPLPPPVQFEPEGKP